MKTKQELLDEIVEELSDLNLVNLKRIKNFS
jgi:hypothetical protein